MGKRLTGIIILAALAFTITPGAARASERKLKLAERLYLQGDYSSAAYECKRLFREYRQSDIKEEAAYLAGLAYLKLNDLSKAKNYFEYVQDNSDDELLINEARVGLEHISKEGLSQRKPSFFAVQIGCFKSKKNATRLYNRYKRRKFTVKIVEDNSGVVTLYKVRIGKFKARKDASRIAKKLRRWGCQTAIVEY